MCVGYRSLAYQVRGVYSKCSTSTGSGLLVQVLIIRRALQSWIVGMIRAPTPHGIQRPFFSKGRQDLSLYLICLSVCRTLCWNIEGMNPSTTHSSTPKFSFMAFCSIAAVVLLLLLLLLQGYYKATTLLLTTSISRHILDVARLLFVQFATWSSYRC